mmetsp:Transcript_15947/g.20967  ORF Transcript_15947/g.20967 Transcript_15947/m.20967 type:complete len:134 (+) Transcript_15947:294-695(+)
MQYTGELFLHDYYVAQTKRNQELADEYIKGNHKNGCPCSSCRRRRLTCGCKLCSTRREAVAAADIAKDLEAYLYDNAEEAANRLQFLANNEHDQTRQKQLRHLSVFIRSKEFIACAVKQSRGPKSQVNLAEIF